MSNEYMHVFGVDNVAGKNSREAFPVWSRFYLAVDAGGTFLRDQPSERVA
jgi:hypothetical protein